MAKVDSLEESLRRLVNGPNTLKANDEVVLSKAEFDRIAAKLANAEAVIEEKDRDNASLRAKMKGGVGLPTCTVTAGSILRFHLLVDGRYRVEPAWTAGAADQARTIPGVAALTSGRELSTAELAPLDRQVQQWAQRRSPACQFRVTAVAEHNDARRFNDQVRTLEQSFYVLRQMGPAKRAATR